MGRDPVAVLQDQARSRVAELVPVRHGRMAESPFAFFRGSAAVMAADLAATPATGITVQVCGDAHVSNFGEFATPERNIVFDVNDFDETLPGPWEWDLKRLCASLHVVASQRSFPSDNCSRVVLAAARSYRKRVAQYADLRVLDLWHDRIDATDVIRHFPRQYRPLVRRDVQKAQEKTHLRAATKLTRFENGRSQFIDDPPLVVRVANLEYEVEEIMATFDNYRLTLSDDRMSLLDRFTLVDVARKVVGVGSVGTTCWVALFEGPDHPDGDRMVLQMKEAQSSVLEPYVGTSALEHHGQRVVSGQRLTQAASDIFLGWTHGPRTGRHYYVRQLWDVKGQGNPLIMDANNLAHYGALCGWALARAHARTGDAVQLSGYLGGGDPFDRAMAAFAASYSRVNDSDFRAFRQAIDEGRIEARTGL